MTDTRTSEMTSAIATETVMAAEIGIEIANDEIEAEIGLDARMETRS